MEDLSMATKLLDNAKTNKENEFYTQLSDIELELKHYKKEFEGKTIFCNCDDPYESNFFKYFAVNFNFLKIKKLIATCFDGSPFAGAEINLFNYLDFSNTSNKRAYKIEINDYVSWYKRYLDYYK